MHGKRKRAVPGLLTMMLALFSLQPIASASTASGQIVTLRLNAGNTPARVSILMPGNTACPTNGWYAFEDADTGLGKIWQEALVAAHMQGRLVTIVGTGTCDSFGVEQIVYIDFD